MLDTAIIDARLREMQEQPDPKLIWDENCGGSARALVVFVGPSPGADPTKPPGHRALTPNCQNAYWNAEYDRPLRWFPQFAPLVEAIFDASYGTAGKLIARGNLDWHNNSRSNDVEVKFMLEGAPSVLRLIEGCSAELVLPLDKKAFRVLKSVMKDSGFTIEECKVKKFHVRLNARDTARIPFCFRATSPNGHPLVVLKLAQHPAKIFRADLATRCGRAVRLAALQIAAGQPVDVTETTSLEPVGVRDVSSELSFHGI